MATYLIAYDLDKPGQDYEDLYETIKGIGSTWWHHLDSTWLVVSNKIPIEIRDKLTAVMDANDKLLVAVVKAPAAWKGFEKSGSDWLMSNLN
jgi:hypothetical protein